MESDWSALRNCCLSNPSSLSALIASASTNALSTSATIIFETSTPSNIAGGFVILLKSR